MTDDLATRALAHWDLPDARLTTALHRENTVWRITTPGGDFALRLHRPGLRQPDEILSELKFMAALARGGLAVPSPRPNRAGDFCLTLDGILIDVLTWVPGQTLPADLPGADRAAAYHALGQSAARLHQIADRWQPPAGFTRPAWDLPGLSGPNPVWGKWDHHPDLSPADRDQLLTVQETAHQHLSATPQDYGLIHGDLVLENVLFNQGQPWLIDFDDCGHGFRLFELATILLRAEREPDYPAARQALLDGYTATRPMNLAYLGAMLALRSLTYLGWIIPRLAEPGSATRSARFVERALRHGRALLEQP